MQIYSGKSVCGGIAVGKIRVYVREEDGADGGGQAKHIRAADVEAEVNRFRKAAAEAAAETGRLYDKARQAVGQADAAVFEIHRMLLEDETYREAVETGIRSQHINAEYAVAQAADTFARTFASMEDPYMRGRAADIKDVSRRLLTILGGRERAGTDLQKPVILVADDLAPSETVQFEKDKVLSFVMTGGSVNSHTAILARAMGIPTLMGTAVAADAALDGKTGIVDGTSGRFYVDPDEETLERLRLAQREAAEKERQLLTLRGRENITLDGQKIMLYANIGGRKDLAAALLNDAGGIGLFRSEFIYLESSHYPTEEEQFEIYRAAAQAMGPRQVIIRTLDIGADKQCGYFEMAKEENPALGCRAIRLCLTRPEVFKTQLRALFRASLYGNIDIMYPMITSVGEVRRIRAIAEEVKRELESQGIRYGNPKQGIMIETPAAAMISDRLAKEADFFSIGTNDLTQYLLAVDRRNPALEEFYDPYHPAVLRMISLVVENAHKEGIRVGICGELGADTALTGAFLAMGVDALSVSPDRILPIRKIVLETDVSEYRKNRPENWR